MIKLKIKLVLLTIMIFITSLNWYMDINYKYKVKRKGFATIMSKEEAKEKLYYYSDKKIYFKTKVETFTRYKTLIPFYFKRKNYKLNYIYNSKNK